MKEIVGYKAAENGTCECAMCRLRTAYAAYANHCAIQKKVPMTWHSWKRAQKLTEGHTREGL